MPATGGAPRTEPTSVRWHPLSRRHGSGPSYAPGMEFRVGDVPLPIDHVAFATPNLETAIARLEQLGLPHTTIATASWPGPTEARTVSAVLLDGYLDVIEIAAPKAAALEPTGVVLASAAIDDTREQLVAAGVRCARPYRIVRRFNDGQPDQTYDVFGVDLRHPCGLAMAVIETHRDEPMLNAHADRATSISLATGVKLLGVELEGP